MIIQTVNEYDFLNAFNSIRPNNFSREALFALFEYLEQLSEDSEYPNMELDVIGICCEYSEYESLEALQVDYKAIDDLEQLQDKTLVIELANGGLIIQDF
tara:strand:- start:232 stop:531 length:300 start_codon:yes stop_codon:yes gene_type:complete